MRTRRTLAATAVFATGALLGWTNGLTVAQDDKAQSGSFTPAQLAERALHRRAVEAVIWGMPAVNYDLMY